MKQEFSASACPESGTARAVLGHGEQRLRKAGVESARLDAELLLGKALGKARERLYLDFERPLLVAERLQFEALLCRRARREPLAYILGEKEFWSLDFIVTPDVLVPRPETECLVEAALGLLAFSRRGSTMRALDLGTGSGAIAVSMARERADLDLRATDISLAALEVAALNARRHGVDRRIGFLAGDLFGPVQELKKSFHLLISNPPYVSRNEMDRLPPEVGEWEPRLALCGGPDGLDFYRRIVRDAPLYLVERGFVALEIGAGMAEEVTRVFAATGSYATPAVHRDLAGRDRVVVAQLQS